MIIPHLYHPKEDAVENNSSIIEKLAFFSFHNNKILIGACVLLIIVSCFTFNNVNFDKDLSKLNYVPTDQKIAEQKLETSSNSISKSLYVVNYGNNVEDVLNQNIALTNKLEQAENKDEILSYNSIQSLVLPTSVQQEKIKDWENFWNLEKVNFVKNEFIKDGKNMVSKKKFIINFSQFLIKHINL